MKFFIRFDIENSAFDDCPRIEIIRILEKISEIIEPFGSREEFIYKISDLNGNIIGKWGVMA